jgi:hypothetical protein
MGAEAYRRRVRGGHHNTTASRRQQGQPPHPWHGFLPPLSSVWENAVISFLLSSPASFPSSIFLFSSTQMKKTPLPLVLILNLNKRCLFIYLLFLAFTPGLALTLVDVPFLLGFSRTGQRNVCCHLKLSSSENLNHPTQLIQNARLIKFLRRRRRREGHMGILGCVWQTGPNGNRVCVR